MKRKFLKYSAGALVLLTTATLLTACGGSQKAQNASEDTMTVMTTFYPMYHFTEKVVGEEGAVELLIPAGTDAHDFEPSAKDIARISDADLFIYNSPEFETWADDILATIDQEQLMVVEASQGITLLEDTAHDHEEEAEHADHDHDHEVDPHVWLDPVLAQEQVTTIRDALIKKYPSKKAAFEENASAYIRELKELDAAYQTGLTGAENRTFVTQHAAFAYLAHRYDLVQESVSGISPDQEPSPSRLAQLKKFIETNDISVIYFEAAASSKVAETLAQETGVELSVLQTLESMTEADQKAGKDYISVMMENLEALKKSIK